VGGKEYAIQSCLAQQRLKIHMRQVRSITCPNICVQTLLESPHMVVVPMQNPMVHFHPSTLLGSSILDELVSQIMHGPPSQNV